MAELLAVLDEVGLEEARVVEEFDTFGGTSKESIVRKYGVIGVNVIARKR